MVKSNNVMSFKGYWLLMRRDSELICLKQLLGGGNRNCFWHRINLLCKDILLVCCGLSKTAWLLQYVYTCDNSMALCMHVYIYVNNNWCHVYMPVCTICQDNFEHIIGSIEALSIVLAQWVKIVVEYANTPGLYYIAW